MKLSTSDKLLLCLPWPFTYFLHRSLPKKDTTGQVVANLIQVAYYGLAAAGVLCLALLYNTFDRAAPDATPSKTIRDLSVLVAEIETGALLQPEDPNYALLSGAARTINNLLDRLISNRFTAQVDTQTITDFSIKQPLRYSDEELDMWDVHGLQDFDPAFWLNLSEHPFLMTPEGNVPVFP
jgi:hypothetical protein